MIVECFALCMYVRVHLVSRSHFSNLKMADPANVWDLPSKNFLVLEVYGRCCFKTYKRHFALTIGAHWRKMRPLDPLWQPVAQFEETTRRRIILKSTGVADAYLGKCTSNLFKEIVLRSF